MAGWMVQAVMPEDEYQAYASAQSKPKAQAARPDNIPTSTVSARRLDPDDMRKRLVDQGYSPAGAEGIVRNFTQESGGSLGAVGDGGTSIGVAQWHGPRKEALEAYAKAEGKDWHDPDVQFGLLDKEMRTQFPKLRETLANIADPAAAEDQFKRIFERPASVLWQNNPNGGPILGNDRYQFSDYAMREHDGRKNTNVVYMDPQDYLDLSPGMDDETKNNRSGQALRASVGAGDRVESIPSLDMKVSGQTGTVTGQDGRHRALLAQEEGIDAIPVAINQRGSGEPTEIAGMSGNILPNDFRQASDVKHEPGERGILGKLSDAIIPRAEAAETAPAVAAGTPGAWSIVSETPENQWSVAGDRPDGDQRSRADKVGTGLLDIPVGAAQLIGNTVGAVGGLLPGAAGRWAGGVADFANRKTAEREAGIQAERGGDTSTDWWRLGGNVAGTLPLSALGGAAAGAGLVARLGGAALAGGATSALQPTPTEGGNFWTQKAEDVAAGAAGGAALGGAGAALGKVVAPTLRGAVQSLVNEGVQLTPGQMAGGAVRRTEDAMASIPILGNAVRAAQRRSIETFNTAAINRSLSDIGEALPKDAPAGHAAIDFAQRKFGDAYDKVIPRMRGAEDAQYKADMVAINQRAAAENLPPEYQAQLHHIIGNELVSRFNAGNGTISGADAQKIGTQLDALTKAMRISANPYEQHLGRLVKDIDAALDNMMARNNPTLQPIKDRIDAGYAKFKIVQRAASAVGANDGVFTPAQLTNAVKARDLSKDKSSFARGAAMMQDLSDAAKDVLPRTVPDSGTPERMAFLGLAGGAGHMISPLTGAGLLAGAAPYTKAGQRLTNSLVSRLAQQPGPTRNALAQMLNRSGGITGPLAGATIPTITVHPSPDQSSQ